MRIVLAGATGAIGTRLTTQLVERGHEVVGIVRSPSSAAALTPLGASTVIADVLDRDQLLRALDGVTADVVVSELSALKKPPLRHADMRVTNRLRTEGTRNLVEAARVLRASRFVTQSMVFGYGYRDLGAAPLTEDAPFGRAAGDAFDEHLEAMSVNETLVREAPGLDGIALRYGLFYGGDIGDIAGMLRKRMLPSVPSGGALPFVHHDDAASATVVAIERGEAGRAYNVADDDPVSFGTLVDAIAVATGAPRPWRAPAWLARAVLPYGGMMMAGARMSVSTSSLQALGWRPRYPSYREGVPASVRAITGLIPS